MADSSSGTSRTVHQELSPWIICASMDYFIYLQHRMDCGNMVLMRAEHQPYYIK